MEQHGTYTLDPEQIEELTRLDQQSQWIKLGINGVLPEFGNTLPDGVASVADIACSTGRWAREIAQRHPAVQVTGIDISQIMIAFAQKMVVEQKLPNVQFSIGNILQPLPFADHSFDFVNASLLFSVLHTDRWLGFLEECFRIAKPGAILRLVEPKNLGESNSPALTRLSEWMMRVHIEQQYGFSDGDVSSLHMTGGLTSLLEKHWTDMHIHHYHFNYSAGSRLHTLIKNNAKILYRGWRSQGHFAELSEEEWQHLYQSAMHEMEDEQFVGTWELYVITAKKPV